MSANPLEEDLNHILRHTRDVWEELRDNRVFISGGTGFFGRWLLESFLWANSRLSLNASIFVLTRNPEVFTAANPHLALHPGISLTQGDVRSFDFPHGEFRFVIHAATDSDSAANRHAPDELRDTITGGTRRMLEFATRCGASSFLFTSSGAVYGRQPSHLTHIAEDFIVQPDEDGSRSAYAEGKRIAESLCEDHAAKYKLDCKVARCFAFTGPYMPLDGSFAIANFIRDALAGHPIRLSGDGAAYRSYLYSADLAIWLWTILFRGQNCRPYNVGSEADLTLGELACKVAALLEDPNDVEIMRRPQSGGLPERYVPSTQRARTELGLAEWTGLDQAILKTAQWHRLRMSELSAT